MKKTILGVIVCMLLILTALPSISSSVIIDDNIGDIKNLEFAPGEFIVKFNAEAIVDVSKSSDSYLYTGISSIDILNEKHHVISVGKLFNTCEKSGQLRKLLGIRNSCNNRRFCKHVLQPVHQSRPFRAVSGVLRQQKSWL